MSCTRQKTLRADFQSSQKLLAAILRNQSKEINHARAHSQYFMTISLVKIVFECFRYDRKAGLTQSGAPDRVIGCTKFLTLAISRPFRKLNLTKDTLIASFAVPSKTTGRAPIASIAILFPKSRIHGFG